MTKRIIFSIIIAIISFIIIIAMLPTEITAYCANDNDIVSVLNSDSVFYANNCELESDGKVTIYNDDASIEIRNEQKSGQTVNVKLAKPAENDITAQLYFTDTADYTEANSTYGFCTKGNTDICFTIPENFNCTYLRLDIDTSYYFGSLEFHSEAPELSKINIFDETLAKIIPLISSIFVFAIIFLIDIKLKFIEKIFDFISKKYKKALIIIGVLAFDIAIGWIISKYVFKFSTFANTVFVIGVIAAVTLFAFGIKFAKDKFENILLGLILIFGTVMILAVPFGHTCWDLDSHYPWALQASTINTGYLTYGDKYVASVLDFEDAETNEQNIIQADELNNIVASVNDNEFSIAHLPSGIFIAVARFFGADFNTKFIAGKFANLLIYAFVFYAAAKKLKSGKVILSIFALFPTSLFLASSYSYDYFVTSFIALGVCSFVGELQNPDKPMTVKNSLSVTLPIAIGTIPKLIYMPLLVLPYFMRKEKGKFGNKKKYYTVCTLTIIVFCLLFLIRSFFSIKGGGDMRGGADVNTKRQLLYILQEPFEFIKTYFGFIKSYYSPKNAEQYISHFAYLGFGKGGNIIFWLLVAAAFTDKSKYDSYTNGCYGVLLKAINVLLFIGTSSLIAGAFYLVFTPVGADYIAGCQWRYLTPLIIAPMLVIGNGKHTVSLQKINGTIYNYAFTIPICVFVFLSIYNTMLFI